MVREQLPYERAAQLFILQSSPAYKRKNAQCTAFRKATSMVKDSFEMVEGSRKQRKALTSATMRHIFAPMSDQIVRKHKHMEFLNSKLDDHKTMMERMRTCKDPTECAMMLEELDQLLDRSPLLGFASKGENQWRYHWAATYTDEFVGCSENGSYMRFIFICMSGHADFPCMTIQQSKEWKTKSGDPLWPGGYECPCGTTYRHKYGVLVEIVAPGVEGIL
jgi:hypothetical protein